MSIRDQITAALADYGITAVSFLPVEGTKITTVRITDQPYRDQDVVSMIAHDIVEPLLSDDAYIMGFACNALYGDVSSKVLGAAIMIRNLD